MTRSLLIGTSLAAGIAALIMAVAVAPPAVASETNEAACGSTGEKASGGEWISLFNGKDLQGWEVMGRNKQAFQVKDGVIECNGSGGHWLRYADREFGDFVFSLEYKASKGANSGIFLRAATEANPAYTGMEIQILDDYGQDPRNNTTGSIYGSITPMLNQSKPAGEWNQVEITCQGERVVVVMNGVKIIDILMNQHDSLRQRLRKGYVGVQDHGHFIWFRNLKLKAL